MIFRIADDDDSPSAGFDFVSLRNAFSGVVSALGVKVGTNLADYRANVFFCKDHDSVHVGERSENFGTLFCGHYRPALALQSAYRSVGIHSHNQPAAKFARRMQVADMTYVQNVEAAVRERYAITGAPPVRDAVLKFVAGDDFFVG